MFRRTGLAVVTAGLVALTGCGMAAARAHGRHSPHRAASSGGTLTLGVIQQLSSFAAADSNWANQSPYEQAVYDTLLHASPSGAIQPWLATSWSYNKAHTVLTMKLRKGVKFTDGSTFTASVAAQNLIRFKHGQSPNASFLARVRAARATGPYTLQIRLSSPDPALLNYLTQDAGLMESAKAFHSKNVATVPDGSGPYVYDPGASVSGSTWTFTANPHYWAPSSVHYKKLVIKYYGTNQAMIDAIQGHQIDAANTNFDPSFVAQIKSAGFHQEYYSLNWFGMLLLDRAGKQTPAMGNVKVRQAINDAFNRKALLRALAYNHGKVTEQVFAPSSPAYSPALDSAYTYNVAKAKALMAQAGYPHGFSMTLPDTPLLGSSVYALIQQELGAIGIKVTYDNVGTNYLTDLLAPKFSAGYMILQEDPTPWQDINFQIGPETSWNPFRYTTPTVTRLMHTVQYGSTAKSNAAAKQLNEYIVKQAWFAPWYRAQAIFATNASTLAPIQSDNCYPYLWNIRPKA